ncbi:PHP domain-containing protein [Fusobacterium ulcerans]|uniref:PHP domain-containing protein n=3 Tax=Fusobacterium TaxID=848 RepID=UPI001E5944BE|nr:PHP domain-containing protein [Fusobacterium ulcerans]
MGNRRLSLLKDIEVRVMEVDMHIHTIASDGTFTPEEVVKRAKSFGMKTIAITDHDTVDGLAEGKKIADEVGIEFIQGIEISCNIDNLEVHILGYFLNLEDEEFLTELEELKKARENRNKKVVEKLEKCGIVVDMEKVKNMAPGNIISRVHIANYLVEIGAAFSKNDAFEKYLGKTGAAYVPKENFPPERAVKMLHANGAFVSMAHPKLITQNDGILENMISELKKLGLGGLEAVYGTFTPAEKRKYKKMAKRHSLLVTGGSDFHGANREGIDIGDTGLEYSQFRLIKERSSR